MTISGVTIGRSSSVSVAPRAAEPEPGQAEAEQRPEDRRDEHRDDRDLERDAQRVEQVVVGEQPRVPVEREAAPARSSAASR